MIIVWIEKKGTGENDLDVDVEESQPAVKRRKSGFDAAVLAKRSEGGEQVRVRLSSMMEGTEGTTTTRSSERDGSGRTRDGI